MKITTNADDESGIAHELETTEPCLDNAAVSDGADLTPLQGASRRARPSTRPVPSTAADRTEDLSENKARESSLLSRGIPCVPHYEIYTYLGAGTYGEVWLARDLRTGIKVAIKFFKHGSGGQWRLLQSEVQQLAQLHSDPGIVQLIDVEPDAETPYYVMAFVENGSLAERLDRGPLPLTEAVEIFRQVAEALAYVHAKGIRHCDLKPSNILLDVRGRARIADFGQAHLSSEICPALGTFFYMAPEQANLADQIADTRWDVYALGAILYAMLTGHPPREDPKLRAEINGTAELSHRLQRYRDWVRASPQPRGHRRARGIDRLLVSIIDRCLEFDPEKRLRDAGAVLKALEQRRRTVRQRAMLGFGLVAPVVLMLGMAGLTLSGADRALVASQNALTDQLCRSDSVSAKLAAVVVEEEIVGRLQILNARSGDPRLAEVVQSGDRKALKELIAAYGREAEAENVGIVRWTFADGSGSTLTNYPWDPMVCNKSWAWRDWFNGKGDQYGSEEGSFPPIRETHVSQPFVGRTREHRKGIVLSAPVFDPAPVEGERPVLGVLALTIELEKIDHWLRSVRLNDGFAVLFDKRYHCLVHDQQVVVNPGLGRNPPTWISPTYQEVIERQSSGHTHSYVDPVDRQVYLAGFAPLPRIGWGIIVQHNRDRVLDQIASVTYRLMRISRVAFVAAGLLISALWGWQFWTLRRVQRMADA